MDEQDIIRQICVRIPLLCPKCNTAIRLDRIDLRGDWQVMVLCAKCGQGYPLTLNQNAPAVVQAKEAVCGDRSVWEEARLLSTGDVPPNYEERLPSLFGFLWSAGPKDDPHPPPTRV